MAATDSRKSTKPLLRPLSPSGRFFNSRPPPSSYSSAGSVIPSARFTLDWCSISPNRSISVNTSAGSGQVVRRQSNRHQKRTCMCSPTTHPGSFRCSLHKNFGSHSTAAVRYSPNWLNARRSAMTNSLVRIRGVEGEYVKRALAALIRPSSHNQRRRCDFRPRRSRLCFMSKAEDDS
ncbi:hypothetical protein TanjilG_16615 [Lupinus angustifolius]|uniref:Serine-rich protein-like protein n=1 Tax=Lupinus angustifolius TaxID=3871 RepID=A0A4P1QZU9_LUPAN|nr:PREDICTED: uncharacterized protein LOC109326193 [Lupinus angustifolius]OIV98288.1 hypothetical protein TanjilG_16615 [Lupinus angustifolius]